MNQKQYVSDYLIENASKLADEDFLICDNITLSWKQLFDESQKVAAFLAAKLKFDQQRIVGIMLPDSWQFVAAYFGIVTAGNMAMPIDITFKKLEVEAVIAAAKPDLVIASQQTRHLIDEPTILIEDILATSAKNNFSIEPLLPPDQQIATLFLSSGTTGDPKPIPNTHANQLWDVEAIAGPMGWTKNDSLLITLHLAHRHGLVICLLGAVYHGNKVYLSERFSAERTLSMLASGKVSIYSSVPAAYEKLVEFEPEKTFDLSSVRLFASSSSMMPPYLAKTFKKRFGYDILDRYGTSETGSIAISKTSDDATYAEPLAGVSLRLEAGGEIALKSPGLFPGYYKNPNATAKNMTSDGWWLTGDIGEMREGKIRLKGRSKERINKGGYSIYPQDIEWALKHQPNIKEVKVVGIPSSNQLDDQVVAVFVGDATEQELVDYCKLNLPRSWRPDIFIASDHIPKTANGKTSLVKLKKMLEEAITAA